MAERTNAASTSAASASCDPTAATSTCRPSRLESKTGVRAVVAQTTTSADRSASATAGSSVASTVAPAAGPSAGSVTRAGVRTTNVTVAEGDLGGERVDVPDPLRAGAEDDDVLRPGRRGAARAAARRCCWPASGAW